MESPWVSAFCSRQVTSHRCWFAQAWLAPDSLACQDSTSPTVLPLPILIKCTYVLVLFLSFFCLNSSFPCLGPIYYSEMSLEWDSFKTLHYGLWIQIHRFDFTPTWAKYLGFWIHFSQIEMCTQYCEVLRSIAERRGLSCLGGSGTQATVQFSFSTS